MTLTLYFSTICHQMPERSFELWGHQAAACHRCLGLYAGFVVGLLAVPGWGGLRRMVARRPSVIVVFALPLVPALNGLLLIAWTASFTYLCMERFWQPAQQPAAKSP